MKRILFAVAVVTIGLAAGSVDAQSFTPDPKSTYKVLAFRSVATGKLEGVVVLGRPGRPQGRHQGAERQGSHRPGGQEHPGAREDQRRGPRSSSRRTAPPPSSPRRAGRPPCSPRSQAAFASASRTNEVVEAGEVFAEGTATVSAVDKATNTVTFTGPEGRSFPVKVENPALLDGVSVGQKVDYRILDVVAIDVKVTPKPVAAAAAGRPRTPRSRARRSSSTT